MNSKKMFESFADLLVYKTIGLEPTSNTGAAVHFFVMDVTKIFAMLVLIIYIMGLLQAMLSPKKVREYVCNHPDWQAQGTVVTRKSFPDSKYFQA